MGARTSDGDPEYNVDTRLLQSWHDTGCILNGESLGLASLLMERKRGGSQEAPVMRHSLLYPLPEDPTHYDSPWNPPVTLGHREQKSDQQDRDLVRSCVLQVSKRQSWQYGSRIFWEELWWLKEEGGGGRNPTPPTGSRSQSSWSSLRPGFSENKGAFDVTTESKSWNCLTMTTKYHNPSWVLTLNREQLLVLITEFAKDDRNLWLVCFFNNELVSSNSGMKTGS